MDVYASSQLTDAAPYTAPSPGPGTLLAGLPGRPRALRPGRGLSPGDHHDDVQLPPDVRNLQLCAPRCGIGDIIRFIGTRFWRSLGGS